ncbi:hypothetical protein SOMG_03403 [Schizosaccharomyces osmophilus]|uniref:Uncharacterized protein n=1 Tax=Schizosaccharomyces osmophilus TaxID=2545709 RepID=A0AAF0AY48_9SCHI|nr:uncharacterized protein SOMG_03403 [Schizosaccharomyces osmophilus]WBW74344.1 hypothetical protein SOMG_03403 [Schizosaccharomyces osmophilus]
MFIKKEKENKNKKLGYWVLKLLLLEWNPSIVVESFWGMWKPNWKTEKKLEFVGPASVADLDVANTIVDIQKSTTLYISLRKKKQKKTKSSRQSPSSTKFRICVYVFFCLFSCATIFISKDSLI